MKQEYPTDGWRMKYPFWCVSSQTISCDIPESNSRSVVVFNRNRSVQEHVVAFKTQHHKCNPSTFTRWSHLHYVRVWALLVNFLLGVKRSFSCWFDALSAQLNNQLLWCICGKDSSSETLYQFYLVIFSFCNTANHKISVYLEEEKNNQK